MNKRVRVNIDLPLESAVMADQMAERRGVSRSMVCRIALGVLHSMDQATDQGKYAGIVSDPDILEQVLVEPL